MLAKVTWGLSAWQITTVEYLIPIQRRARALLILYTDLLANAPTPEHIF
jgi:hypothetical protein